MRGKTPTLIVAALVLLAAGVAAANNPLLNGPSPGLAVNGPVMAQSTTGTTTPPTATTPLGTTSTNGTLNGTLGTTTPATSATGTAAPSLAPATAAAATTAGALAIEQVVSITRTVEVGPPVNAFTVPAGQQLVVTDVLITNPGPTTVCSAAVGPAGAATTTDPLAGGTTAATAESGTGVLCVPAQTSLSLGLTTGLEFAGGQSVQLANSAPVTTTPPATTGGPLHYHLRGFLMSAGA